MSANLDCYVKTVETAPVLQLDARSEPALLDDPDPAAALRRERVRFYLAEMEVRPTFADREQVLALLRTPLEPPTSPR